MALGSFRPTVKCEVELARSTFSRAFSWQLYVVLLAGMAFLVYLLRTSSATTSTAAVTMILWILWAFFNHAFVIMLRATYRLSKTITAFAILIYTTIIGSFLAFRQVPFLAFAAPFLGPILVELALQVRSAQFGTGDWDEQLADALHKDREEALRRRDSRGGGRA